MAVAATSEQRDEKFSVRDRHLYLMDSILKDNTRTSDPILASFQAWTQMFDEALELIK